MSRSLILGLVGLSVVVALVFFLGRDESTDIEVTQQPRTSASAPNKPNPMQESAPKSLELGRPSSGTSSGSGTGSDKAGNSVPGSGSGQNARSRANLDRYRQAHRSTVGGPGPRHPGREDDDESAPNVQVKSQIDEPERLSDKGESKTRGANAANRAVVDEWAGVDAAGDPASDRQPEEGEVLSLFEGDAITSQTEASVAKNVTLDENNAEFTADSEYAVPMAGKLTGDSGSISFWVKPNGETSDTDNASLVQLRAQTEWNNRIQVWKDGSNIRMVFADGAGVETGATYGSDTWGDDEWRQVTVTWGDRLNTMYVNGQLAGSAQYEGGFQIQPKTMLHVGSNYSDTPSSLNGSVSKFRVYNRALSPDEIATLPQQYPE